MADIRSLIEDAKKKKNIDRNQFLQDVSATREQRTGVPAELRKLQQTLYREDSNANANMSRYNAWAKNYNKFLADYNQRISKAGTYEYGYQADAAKWLEEAKAQKKQLDKHGEYLKSMIESNRDSLGDDIYQGIMDELTRAATDSTNMLANYQTASDYYGQFKDAKDWEIRSREAAAYRLAQEDERDAIIADFDAKKQNGQNADFDTVMARKKAINQNRAYAEQYDADEEGNLLAPYRDLDLLTVYSADFLPKYQGMDLYDIHNAIKNTDSKTAEGKWLGAYYKLREEDYIRNMDADQVFEDYKPYMGNNYTLTNPTGATTSTKPIDIWDSLSPPEDEARAKFYHDISQSDVGKRATFSNVGNPASAMYDPDFEKIAANKVSTWDGLFSPTADMDVSGAYQGFWELGYRDPTYEYIVNDAWWLWDSDRSKYATMTEQEKKTYAYWYHKEGKYKADQYLEMLIPELEYRAGKAVADSVEGAWYGEIPLGFALGVARVPEQARYWLTNEETPQSATEIASQLVYEDLGDTGFKIGDTSIGQYGYDLAYTFGNMAPSLAVSTVNPVAGAAMLGVTAGGQAYQDKLREGWNQADAMLFGLITGSMEATMEYALGAVGKVGKTGISRISKRALDSVDNVITRVAKTGIGKFVLGGASEALEEGLQSVLEPLVASLISGEIDPVEWEEVAYSAVLGFLTGGMLDKALDSGRTAVTHYNQKNTGRAITSAVGGREALLGISEDAIDLAEGRAKTDFGKQIEDVKKRLTRFDEKNAKREDAGKKAANIGRRDARKIGELYDTAVDTTKKASRSQDVDEIAASLRERGQGWEAAKQNADAIVASINKEELTADQSRALKKMTSDPVSLRQMDGAIDDVVNNPDSGFRQRRAGVDEFAKLVNVQNIAAAAEKAKAKAMKVKVSKDTSAKPDGFVEDNGELKVKTKDGAKSRDNVTYYDIDQAIAYETLYNLGISSADEANAILNDLVENDSLSAEEWSEGVSEAFMMGRAGIAEEVMASSPAAAKLTSVQRMDAYRIGQLHAGETDTPEMQENRASLREYAKLKRKPTEKGVYFHNRDGSDTKIDTYLRSAELTERQMFGVNVMKDFASTLGSRFHLFEVFEEDGQKYYINQYGRKVKGNPSGFYDATTGDIYIALDAGATTRNGFQETMLFTIAHEVTHFIRAWSPSHFNKIANIIIKQAGFDGNINGLIAAQQEKAKRLRGETLTEEAALEEVVADAMETILKDGKVAEMMAKIKKADAGAWEKIKEWFKKVIEIFEKHYGNLHANTTEGQLVEVFEENIIRQLQQLFAEGAVEAGQNFQSAKEEAAKELADNGIAFDEETQTVFALRDSFATNEIIKAGRSKHTVDSLASLVSKVTGRSIDDSRKWVRSEMTIANMVVANPEFLDFDPDNRYEAIKKNSDYPQGTVGLSNLCPKREEFTAMFDLLQKTYPGKLFTAKDIAEMRNILSNAGITVACGACYVEDRRQLIGEIADTFIGMWKRAVETGDVLKKTNAEGKLVDLWVTKDLAKRYNMKAGEKIFATDPYIPNQYDLTTYEGFKKLESDHPLIAMSFNRYNNSRGQQAARLIEGRAEYKRQILGWSPSKVKSVNNNGGLRIFSFSDFEVVHLLDLAQVIIDCAAKGVKIQGYTKIPAFAKLVRATGIKLNRSLIPQGNLGYHMENGKVVLDYDMTEGINIHDENFMDEADNPNVGNIVIGINPTQIGAAMLDPFIDYIIPFHSNKSKAILKALGTGEWINYKESQHEKNISDGKAAKHNVNIYTQVIAKHNPTNKVEFVNAFLAECKAQGLIPRYQEFLNKEYKEDGTYRDEYGAFDYTYREGFHKLLVDFKMFDKDGNILPQENIVPELDEAFMADLLEAEVKRKQDYKFPEKVYAEIKQTYGDPDDTKLSDRDDTSYQDLDASYYQEREGGLSSRELIANALEENATPEELEALKKYKEDIATYAALEQRLKNLNADIQRLSFAKGARDMDAINALRAEAKKTANRINTYDKILLRMEGGKFLQNILSREKQRIRANEKAKRQELVRGKNAEIRGKNEEIRQKNRDVATMQTEFIRLAKEFEKQAEKSGKKIDTLSALRDKLAAEAKQHGDAAKIWEAEFKRLLKAYEDSGRRADQLEKRLANIASNIKKALVKAKIRRLILSFNKRLNRSTKDSNIKKGLQDVVAAAIASHDFYFVHNVEKLSGNDLIKRGIETDLSEKERDLLKKIAEIDASISQLPSQRSEALKNERASLMRKLAPVFERERAQIAKASAKTVVEKMAAEYRKLKDSEIGYIRTAYRSDLDEFLSSVSDQLGDIPISKMTPDQLELLYKAYAAVAATIANANKGFAMEQDISETVASLAKEIRSHKKNSATKAAIFAKKVTDRVGWDYESLYYALRRIDCDTFTKLYTNLMDSEDIIWQDVEEAKGFALRIVEKYGYNKWKVDRTIKDGKTEKVFVDGTGKEFTLTLGELMSLYAYSRRDTAWNHLEFGGFTTNPKALTEEAKEGSYKMNKDAVMAMFAYLTEEQKRFVVEMQTFLSDVMGAKGNEVSMKIHGVELFGEKNYFPLKLSGDFKPIAEEAAAKKAAGFGTMKNAGFTHAQNRYAKDVIVLEDFMSVWSYHVDEMARYHGAVPALEDIRRVMNYRADYVAGEDSMAMKNLLEATFGEKATRYFTELYREANSGAYTDTIDKAKKRTSSMRKAAVMLKASVWIQQVGSISRAQAIIPKRYFGGVLGYGTLVSGGIKAAGTLVRATKAQKETYAKMLTYAPGVTLSKEVGGFDTATGASIYRYLKDTEKGVIRTALTGTAKETFEKARDKVLEFAGSEIPNFMDKLAWIEIWRAAERYTRSLNKKANLDEEEILQRTGKLFTETIRATQVYDSMFSKPPIMRSNNTAVQYTVSFMSEPLKIANMVEDACRCLTRKDFRRAYMTLRGVAKGILLTNALRSIVYAGRDDDENETYLEKYLEAFVGGVINDVIPFNYIPYVRDVWSALRGWDVERPDMALAADLIGDLSKLYTLSQKDTSEMTDEQLKEYEDSVAKAGWGLVFSAMNYFGLPAGNVVDDLDAIKNSVNLIGDEAKTTGTGIGEAIANGIEDAMPFFLDPQNRSKTDLLYNAKLSGDKEYVDRLKKGYKDPEAYEAALRKALRENDPRIGEAAEAYEADDFLKYDEIMDTIANEGNFEHDTVAAAVKAEHTKRYPKPGEESKEKEKDVFTSEDLGDAIIAGDDAEIELITNSMIETDMANGKSHEEAEKAVISSAKTQIKKAYKAGKIDEDTTVDLLMDYGVEEDDAVKTVNHLIFQEEFPEYKDLSATDVADWHEYCEGSVPLDIYYDFTMKVKEMTGGDRKKQAQDLARSYNLLPVQYRNLMETY